MAVRIVVTKLIFTNKPTAAAGSSGARNPPSIPAIMLSGEVMRLAMIPTMMPVSSRIPKHLHQEDFTRLKDLAMAARGRRSSATRAWTVNVSLIDTQIAVGMATTRTMAAVVKVAAVLALKATTATMPAQRARAAIPAIRNSRATSRILPMEGRRILRA